MKAVELAGCLAHECLYMGDSPTKDMLPAKEAGMMTVLISKKPSADDLANADGYISNVKDLATLLP